MSRGSLVLVGTPIGNLDDLSPRAAGALTGADVVACEDTRRTRPLLEHVGASVRRLLVVNDHNEEAQVGRVLQRLEAGDRVALVTDAGMPGISDPGERIVAAVTAAGYAVQVVPGPSAAIAGLVVSGLPAGRFVFEGFLPRQGSGRRQRLEALRAERRTTVLFEAPHRLRRALAELAGACGGERGVAVARELTKLHEEIWRGTLAGAVAWASEREPRGEYVVVLAGAPEAHPVGTEEIEAGLRTELASGAARKDAIATVATGLDVPRRRVYEIAIGLR